MSVSAYGSIRIPRVGSTSCALFEYRGYIGAMKLASFPLELAKPLLRKAYTRDASPNFGSPDADAAQKGKFMQFRNLLADPKQSAIRMSNNEKQLEDRNCHRPPEGSTERHGFPYSISATVFGHQVMKSVIYESNAPEVGT